MRHRANNSKIKYEHNMIPGLRERLESIEGWEEIRSIIPGEICRIKGSGRRLQLSVQYQTQTGLKLLAKTSSSVQEVFVVTTEPLRLQGRIEKLSLERG